MPGHEFIGEIVEFGSGAVDLCMLQVAKLKNPGTYRPPSSRLPYGKITHRSVKKKRVFPKLKEEQYSQIGSF